jgi:hypothetical protein
MASTPKEGHFHSLLYVHAVFRGLAPTNFSLACQSVSMQMQGLFCDGLGKTVLLLTSIRTNKSRFFRPNLLILPGDKGLISMGPAGSPFRRGYSVRIAEAVARAAASPLKPASEAALTILPPWVFGAEI